MLFDEMSAPNKLFAVFCHKLQSVIGCKGIVSAYIYASRFLFNQ